MMPAMARIADSLELHRYRLASSDSLANTSYHRTICTEDYLHPSLSGNRTPVEYGGCPQADSHLPRTGRGAERLR